MTPSSWVLMPPFFITALEALRSPGSTSVFESGLKSETVSGVLREASSFMHKKRGAPREATPLPAPLTMATDPTRIATE